MTGQHMPAKVAYDEYYHDPPSVMMVLSKLLRRNFLRPADAVCRHIQKSLFTMSPEHAVAAAVDAINAAIADLPETLHVAWHICQGIYAIGKDYDGQIGHR